MTKHTFLLAVFLVCSVTFSQTKKFKDIAEVQAFTKKTANDFLNKDFQSVFNNMKPYWALAENEVDSLKIKTERFKDYFNENLGKNIDVVKIKETNLKNVLYKEVYAIRYEDYILRVVMSFYNSSFGWAIKTFEWDDNIQSELD
ncbi:MAG: hypothetical protein NWQ17_00455 [Polaribacter sp.]|nr:hypothetical protein [Polaribacter sp.]